MNKKVWAAAVLALSSVLGLNGKEKSLAVEFTAGDFIGLSDGSVWEMLEDQNIYQGQHVFVRGNYRKEWQVRIHSKKTTMKTYELFFDDKFQKGMQTRLVGICDLKVKQIRQIDTPEYDLTLMELFTEGPEDEMAHLIELDDGSVFVSLSPVDGDVSEFEKQDELVVVRFDLRTYFLINLDKDGAGVGLKMGVLKKERPQKVEKIQEVFDQGISLTSGKWHRVSDFPYFPWKKGEEASIRHFKQLHANTKPEDMIHIPTHGRYVLIKNEVTNEVIIAHQNKRG